MHAFTYGCGIRLRWVQFEKPFVKIQQYGPSQEYTQLELSCDDFHQQTGRAAGYVCAGSPRVYLAMNNQIGRPISWFTERF